MTTYDFTNYTTGQLLKEIFLLDMKDHWSREDWSRHNAMKRELTSRPDEPEKTMQWYTVTFKSGFSFIDSFYGTKDEAETMIRNWETDHTDLCARYGAVEKVTLS